MKRFLLMAAIGLLVFSTGCAATKPTDVNEIIDHTTVTPVVTPEIAPSPTPGVPPSVTPDSHLQTKNLDFLIDAWNSRDIKAIKALYTEDARIFSETEAKNLENEAPLNVQVSEELISSILQTFPENMQMHIVGEPFMVYDKLVAYTYRLEDDLRGYNATGLLRLEGDNKIFLQVFLVSEQLTDNGSFEASNQMVSKINEMIAAWSKTDQQAAANLYASDAVIISDEDMLQVPWRDFSTPPGIEKLLNNFSGWDPQLVGVPMQSEDMAIFAWRWGIREYPVAYGIRMVKMEGGVITLDIRFAIRPWEAKGKAFPAGG